jgi:hypothetical protein
LIHRTRFGSDKSDSYKKNNTLSEKVFDFELWFQHGVPCRYIIWLISQSVNWQIEELIDRIVLYLVFNTNDYSLFTND